jgi:Divergent InlB B-repeat domain
MKKALVILAVVLAARWLAAQGTTADSCAPMLLYTNGAGTFSPYYCGQMVQTGQVYTVSAIPNHGYRFRFWRQVKVAIEIKTVIYPSDAIVSTTNTMTTPTPIRSREATMKFNMGAPTVQVRDDNPGTTTTTKSSGWEANFVRSAE